MKKTSFYIKATAVIGRLWKNRPREISESSQPAAYYRTCNQLTLDRFIRVLVDGELSALIISGVPEEGALAEAWAGIYYEYLEINKDNESIYIINLERDISLLSDELNRIDDALEFISAPSISMVDPDTLSALQKVLADYGYKIDFTLSGEKHVRQIKVLKNRYSSRRLELTRKVNEYNDYISEKQNMTIDRSYFNRMLNRMGKHFNCYIEESKITVARFVDMIQQYFSELQAKKQRAEDVKHG